MTPCATCHLPLTGPDAVLFCERADCMWDFSPVVAMGGGIAYPSPEYWMKAKAVIQEGAYVGASFGKIRNASVARSQPKVTKGKRK